MDLANAGSGHATVGQGAAVDELSERKGDRWTEKQRYMSQRKQTIKQKCETANQPGQQCLRLLTAVMRLKDLNVVLRTIVGVLRDIVRGLNSVNGLI
jgi:hypothetical protein